MKLYSNNSCHFCLKVTNDGSLAKSQKEEIFSFAFQLLLNCFYLLALCLFIFVVQHRRALQL